MKKAMVIPKVAAAVLCIVIGLVIVLPALPVMSNRMFGGGTMDINTAAYSDYRSNRPVGGSIYFILGASEGTSESGGALSNGSYYYLVPVSGKEISNKNKVDTLLLVKAVNGSDIYSSLNDIYRSSASGDSASGFEITGVLRDMSDDEEETATALRAPTGYGDLKLSEYTLDLTIPVKTYTIRFAVSLIFFALAIGSIFLTIQAINKNAQLEDIEDRRMAFRLEQEKKSGNKNDDGSDKMFGDSDASFGTTPRKNDDSDGMLGESSPGTGGYNPAFQSQGGEDFTTRTSYDDADEDGFFGGGSAAPGQSGFFGGSQSSRQSSGPFDNGLYGGVSQPSSPFDDSLLSGSQGGFYGGSSQNDDDDYGFFGGR